MKQLNKKIYREKICTRGEIIPIKKHEVGRYYYYIGKVNMNRFFALNCVGNKL